MSKSIVVLFMILNGLSQSLCATSKCEDKLTCDACLGVPDCSWCKELRDVPFQRCNTIQGQRANKCPDSEIEKAEKTPPKIVQNDPINNSVKYLMRIQPQKIKLQLAVGQPVPISLKYKDSTDRALDLYYIMDLSATMEDDRNTVSAQAIHLESELQVITKDIQLGFGSFIDKPVLPFVSSSQLRGDRDSDKDYAIPYSFTNLLSLTKDISVFKDTVAKAQISRNLDEPEGTLDALMQAITCKQIGWRNTSRKLIVVATDGPFHIAGDGKLGGIVRPNDMKCHMENNRYTHSKILDYPSIGEINAVILDHKVYVIFAVSRNISKLQESADHISQAYDELKKHVTQSTVVRLEADSSNVVQEVKKKYKEISNAVTLRIDGKPPNVDVNVLAKCSQKGGYHPGMICTNVAVGDEIDFKLEITLKECPRKGQLQEKNQIVVSFFELTPNEKLVIDLDYACQCKCNEDINSNENSLNKFCTGPDASKHISCGLCNCKEGRSGDHCQCSESDKEENFQGNCTRPTSQVQCSDRGECKCGKCVCQGDYNGRYCEDSTMSCQSVNSPDRLCSGNGDCEKGACKCEPEYKGKYCECKKSTEISCVEPGKSSDNLCNGQGICDCNGDQAQCRCNVGYGGLYCETCKVKINCAGSEDSLRHHCKDKLLQESVKCRVQTSLEGKKPSDCDGKCKLQATDSPNKGGSKIREAIKTCEIFESSSLSDEDGTECEVQINSTCTAKFRYAYQRDSDVLQVYYVPKEQNCIKDRPIIWIVFIVIASVLLAGILGLLVWKLATHIHDTREFHRFEKERSGARWQGGENPLYNKPMSEFQNPAYRD